MERAKGKITRSSGNVFKDLGFGREEAEHLVIRSELMIKIEKLLKRREEKYLSMGALSER